MQNNKITILYNEAKELEKKYNWLDAKDAYGKAAKIALSRKDYSEAAELSDRRGYCLFRAALQAETKEKFKMRMKAAVKAYKRLVGLTKNGNDSGRKYHANAMVAYTSSWLEPNLTKMETLLEDWWRSEKKALLAYQENQNDLAIGKTCNNLMEYSVDRRIFFKKSEFQKRRFELIDIGEKSISTLIKTNDKYELARAYCWTAWYYGIGINIAKIRVRGDDFHDKWFDYSNKAVVLSEEVGDGWLIGWSYNVRSNVGTLYAKSFSVLISDAEKVIEQGKIIKDNYMMLTGKWQLVRTYVYASDIEENPEINRQNLTKAVQLSREALFQSKIINAPICILLTQFCCIHSLVALATFTPEVQEKRKLIQEAIKLGRAGIKYTKGRTWVQIIFPMEALSQALLLLANIEENTREKRKLLEESLEVRKLARAILIALGKSREAPRITPNFVWGKYLLALTQSEIAEIETDNERRVSLYKEAIYAWEECLELSERMARTFGDTSEWIGSHGIIYYNFGKVLTQIYNLETKKSWLTRALEVYNKGIEFFKKFELTIHVAESYWRIATTYDLLCENLEASQSYFFASKAYKATTQKIPQLGNFCQIYSKYMLAWSEIEKAKHAHSMEDYEKSKIHYEKAAELHETSESWSYLSSNYFAWGRMEEAENLSRKENTQKAKQTFQKALDKFTRAKKAIKQKLEETISSDEKEMIQRLLKVSDLRKKYCQSRILLEDAKLLDREGKYLQSSKNYGKAAHNISIIVEKMDVEAERKELEYLTVLCQAWEKMALAEETASSESYLEAAKIFEQAKEHCYTKKASMWTLGNSNFCKGLAAGARYQGTMDLKENALCKSYLKNAASCYSQAGFKSASEYAKATQRLFDAYVFMNQAEREVDLGNKAKQYQIAENLLQISAGSFMKAKQPEKTAQVEEIINTVREEKALAVSLNEVLHAPTITSSTMSFAAPSPTSEVSVGLEQFQHANVQANLIAGLKEVKVGESFCLSIEFVNAGKEPALLTRVEDFVPPDFIVVKKPEIYRLEDTCLNMKGKQIAPLKLVEAKLVLQPSKKGVYKLKPTVHYLDELGQNKSLQLKSVEIKVEEVVLADRVSTGTKELDSLLLGGIPKEYAVVLTGPPSDERELIVKNFLEAGTRETQTIFYVTIEAVGIENLLDKAYFYLFLCNPKPKVEVPDLPNVTKLRSKTDINNLNMALARESRNLQAQQSPKRLCIEIVSDVLLRLGPEVTRRWLSELITDLGSKGFTVLAVLDSGMHTSEEANAIAYLFDGEISLYQTEDPLECKKFLRVKKLRNQDYIKNPICLIQQK